MPSDNSKQAGGRLQKHKQLKSDNKYLEEFQSIIITTPEISDEEKLYQFTNGLKCDVRFEVLKSHAISYEKCARVALNIDSEL